ncbi:MAG TPA: hypothetical protein VD962_04130, partial [Rubricoccaceae bacterium]|nr:hypothetical protein [Rubricoccaceae bacterium]
MRALFLMGWFLAAPAFAQPFALAVRGGGPGFDASQALVLTDEGPVVAGYFSQTAAFPPLSLASGGSTDGFVVSYAFTGQAVWARRCPAGAGGGWVSATALAADGDLVLVGTFGGPASCDGGSAPDGALANAGVDDAFLARYSPDGTLRWAISFGGASDDRGWDVAAGPDGAIYVAGYFSGTATFGAYTLTSAGARDAFLARVNADGTVAWARKGGGVSGDAAWAVAVEGSGVWLAGEFSSVALFGALGLESAGALDAFLVRYDAAGTAQ